MRFFSTICFIVLSVELFCQTLVAHRGYSALYPENTLVSIEQAVNFGFDFIEMDLRTTKDAQVVLLHDDSVDRTSNGTGNINRLTYEEVANLNFGYPDKFGDEYEGTKIPTLSEAIVKIDKRAQIVLDLKESNYISSIHQILQEHSFDESRTSFIVYTLDQSLEVKRYFKNSRVYLTVFSSTELNGTYLSMLAAIGIDGLALNNKRQVTREEYHLFKKNHFDFIIWNIGSINELNPRFQHTQKIKLIVDNPNLFPLSRRNELGQVAQELEGDDSGSQGSLVHAGNYIFFYNPRSEVILEASLVSISGRKVVDDFEIKETGFFSTNQLKKDLYILLVATDHQIYTLKFYPSR